MYMRAIKIILAVLPLFFAELAFAVVCTVSTTAVNFGNYDVLLASPTDSTGSITVTCDKTDQVIISIGASPNSGVFNPRQMISASLETLNYNLYTDSTYTSIWGDGTGGTSTLTVRAVKNKPEVSTVYGRIPPEQDISADTYGETLTVTITW